MAGTTSKSAKSTVTSVTAEQEQERIIPKEIDPNQFITVRNGFHGFLVYKSPRSGEVYMWNNFGDEQEIELRELRNAKSSSKGFFQNNWFMFDDEFSWVIDYLGVRQYYKHFLSIDTFDDIFEKTPAQLKKAIEELSEGQKHSLAYRAGEKIRNGEIDSLKTITALEEALGIELIEK